MVTERDLGLRFTPSTISTIEDEPAPRALNFLDFDVDRIGARRVTRPPGPSPVERQEFVNEHLQQFGTAPSAQQIRDFRRGPAQEDLSIPGDVFTPPDVIEDTGFAPTNEEVLANFAPAQVYQAQLNDFITAQQSAGQSVLQDLSDQYDAALRELQDFQTTNPTFTVSDFNRQLAVIDKAFTDAIDQSGVMTEAKGKEILDEAQRLIGQGLSPEEVNQQLSLDFPIEPGDVSPQGEQFRQGSFIPGLADIQGVTGAKLGELLNQGLEISQTAFDLAQPQGLSPEQELQAGRFAQTQGNAITGTEERDYYGLVQGLGLSLQVEQYMMGRFQEFYQQWLQTGPSMEFLQWLRIQMGG